MAVKYLVQHRRGTAEQWAEQSTLIPREGEIVIEIDEVNSLHKLKIGDGVHTYAELAYLQAGDEIVTQVLNRAQPRVVTVELTLNWTPGENNTYSQVIALDNITKHSRLDLQPSAAMIAEFKELGLVFVTENNGGEITVYSIGNKPLKSYTMQATIVEVECTGDNVIGVPVVAPRDTITRADIKDFAYTHSDVLDQGGYDEGWLKITIDADSTNIGINAPDEILFDLYVKEYYNISHWTIHGAWGHEEGISSLHTVETHMAHVSLYDKVTSDDAHSCSFYVQDLYGGGDVHVYVNDRGIGGQRVLGLSVEWVTELPDVDNEFFGSLNIIAPVDVNEYADVKANAEAAAPKSTVYTKEEVDELHSGIDNDVMDLQNRVTNLEDNSNAAIAFCEVEGDRSLPYIAVTVNFNESINDWLRDANAIYELVFGGTDVTSYGASATFRVDSTGWIGGGSRQSITRIFSGEEYNGEYIYPVAYGGTSFRNVIYFNSTREFVTTVLCNGRLGYTLTDCDYIVGISATYVASIPETVSTNIHYTTVVEVTQETGNSETAVMSQKAVSDIMYPFGAAIPKTETGGLVVIDRAVEGDTIAVKTSATEIVQTNNNLFVPWSAITEQKSITQKGVTLRYNDDGSFTLSGKSTAIIENLYMAAYDDNKRCKAGTYMVTLNTPLPEGVRVQFAAYRTNEDKYFDTFSYKNVDGDAFEDGIVSYPREFGEDFRFQARIIIEPEIDVGNIILKPQLQPGTTLAVWQNPSRVNVAPSPIKYTGKPICLFADSDDEIEVSYNWEMYSMKEMLELIRDTATDLYNRKCDADEVSIDLNMGGEEVETDVQTAMQQMVDMVPALATKENVNETIANLDYTDKDSNAFVYKVDQIDGVIKPYKKSISRGYITDFRYTHKAAVDLETTSPNARYLKVTVGSPEGWTSMLYKMYVFSYWLAAEVEISTDSSHRTGFGGGYPDKVHSATIFTENLVELVDKIEPAEGSCSFYFKVGGSIEYNGCTVYIDDESGMSDSGTAQKVTSLDVTLVEELPVDAKTFDRIFTVVDKVEYEEVKEKANAAAPQSTTYTKEEVGDLIRQNAYDAVGVTIRKTVFTDRPSLWTWLQENYRSALKVTIKTAEYHASNFGVAITEDQDGTVHFEVSRQIVSTSGNATRSSVYTFEVYNNKVVQYSSCDYIGPDGSVTHSVLDNGITILDEEWAATGIELTVYYFDE